MKRDWTEIIAYVKAKRCEGWTLAQIAKALNVTVGALNMLMRRYGVARDRWGRNQHKK